jgi:exopolysaccharide transport family protein
MDTLTGRPPSGAQSAESSEAAFDIPKLIGIFQRRRILFAVISLEILLAAAVFLFNMNPVYTATASVVLEQRKHDVVNVEEVLSGLPAESSVVDTEVEVLKSPTLAERVARKLGLNRDPEFDSRIREPGRLEVALGLSGTASLRGPVPSADEVAQGPDWDSVIDVLRKNLKISRAGTTYLIQIAYTAREPRKAALIANAFAAEYLVSQLDAKFEATRKANDWLKQRLEELQKQVRDADTAVELYKTQHNLLATRSGTLTEQEVAGLDQQLADARNELAASEARLSTATALLAGGGTGEDLAEALNSKVIQDLRRQLAETSQKAAELRATFGPSHPDVINTERQLDEVRRLLRTEVSRIVSNLKAQVDVARQRRDSLEATAAESKSALANNNEAGVHLRALEQKAESARALYASYLDRYLQTSSQEGIQQSDARIASEAKVPRGPSAPKMMLSLALAAVLAVMAGLVVVFIAESLDSSLDTAEDVEHKLELPFLGYVASLESTLTIRRRKKKYTQNDKRPSPLGAPVRAVGGLVRGVGRVGRKPNLIAPEDYVLKRPFSGFSEGFRGLRASLRATRSGNVGKVVAITSSVPGEGKTTTSLCLARVLGLAGSTAVIVDCDLRRRGVGRILSSEPRFGLVEVLNGIVAAEEVLIADVAPGVSVLPVAPSPFTSRDVFSAASMRKLLDDLRRQYDLVILDCPPILPLADIRVIAPQADAVILLARWRKTPRRVIAAALRVLNSVDANVAGAVLTQVDQKQQAREGYGDAGYYFKHYRHYYSA